MSKITIDDLAGMMNRAFEEQTKEIHKVADAVTDLEERMNERFEQVEKRFKQVDERFDEMDERFDTLEKISGTHERRITRAEDNIQVLKTEAGK